VAGDELRLEVEAAGRGGRVERVRLRAELGDREDLASERRAQPGEPVEDVGVDGRRARVQVLVPALVVRAADRVDVAVHESGAVGHVRAPDVDRDGAPGIEAVDELGGRVDELRLAARVAVVGDLVGQVPREHARVGPGLHDVQAHAAQPLATQGRGGGRPRAGRVDRADALPDEDAGGVEALEERGVQRVLGAGRVGADRAQATDDGVHVGRREARRRGRRRPPAATRRGARSACRSATAGRRPSARRAGRPSTAEPDSPGTVSRRSQQRGCCRRPESRAARCAAARGPARPAPSRTGANRSGYAAEAAGERASRRAARGCAAARVTSTTAVPSGARRVTIAGASTSLASEAAHGRPRGRCRRS
jgi:hypothetical protein